MDDFLKVPGAKVFNVTKHKVTFHDVDSAPEPPSSASASPPKPEADEGDAAATTNTTEAADENGKETSVNLDAAAQDSEARGSEEVSPPVTSVRVRAVTELDRVVFLSQERILVLACPSGPANPGLVKSNHHLTELQKMTFMRRDPALVTLHYLAPEGREAGGDGPSAPPAAPAAAAAAMKRNVYRFDLDDKEAFIRIIRGAIQRFHA